MKLGETTVAIDPVLGDIPMVRRHTPLPVPREQLTADLILITHAHYDHFDKPSVLELLRRNPGTIVVAPQGFWRYMKGHIARERCFELERWESVMAGGVFITLVPARHWSKRTLFDTNKALWGGYVIQNSGHTLYHAGDTAYGAHFKEIAERFGIDEAFLPIGAYRPEIIMRHNHMNPPEAIRAFGDLGADTLIPVHYGTFRLSDEPLDEPLEWFVELMGRSENPQRGRVLRIGEIYRFRTTSTERST
jgi:L-ascorbate metabolism protein UlaG (beta-lactamase superfamily)